MHALTTVILASASPRRVALLQSLGLDVSVRPTGIAEDDVPGLTPQQLAAHHSAAKTGAALAALPSAAGAQLLVASDTVVDLDGVALGKPGDTGVARRMLLALSGRTHVVHTAFDCVDLTTGQRIADVVSTSVRFYDLSVSDIDDYAASGDSADKAGAYGIQGRGAVLVERIDGDFYTVMGFPVARFVRRLSDFGYRLAPAATAVNRVPA